MPAISRQHRFLTISQFIITEFDSIVIPQYFKVLFKANFRKISISGISLSQDSIAGRGKRGGKSKLSVFLRLNQFIFL